MTNVERRSGGRESRRPQRYYVVRGIVRMVFWMTLVLLVALVVSLDSGAGGGF